MSEELKETWVGERSHGLPGDLERIERYLRGDVETFRELDEWIRVALRRSYPGLSGEHEDLAQAAHAKLFDSLTKGRFARGPGLRAYVAGVVHHAAIDRLREVYRGRLLADALLLEQPISVWDNPYANAEAVDRSRLLHQALLAVPRTCRELWRLSLVERLSYEEIAEKLALPIGTVKSRMWHCRRKALSALRRLRFLHESRRHPEG